jgi:hypothetical protein
VRSNCTASYNEICLGCVTLCYQASDLSFVQIFFRVFWFIYQSLIIIFLFKYTRYIVYFLKKCIQQNDFELMHLNVQLN